MNRHTIVFICWCLLGLKTLSEASVCDNSMICGPHSACVVSDTPPGYTCSCYPGFRPPNCTDTDECSQGHNVCNNGKCVNTQGSFRCDCFSGFTGARCRQKQDPCLLSPCQNSGTCKSSSDGSYTCLCYVGFDRSNNCADRNECDMVVGLCHNGTCINTVGSFKCRCRDGFQGERCTRDINECLSSPCSHGSCVNTVGSFKCNCNKGYQGKVCSQNTMTTQTRYPSSPLTRISTLISSVMSLSNLTSSSTTRIFTSQASTSTVNLATSSNTASASTKSTLHTKSNQPYSSKSIETSTSSIVASSSSTRISSSRSASIVTSPPSLLTTFQKDQSTSRAASSTTHSVYQANRITVINGQQSDIKKPWAESHWYILAAVGAALLVGVVITALIVKRRHRKATEYKDLQYTESKPSTILSEPITQENPLYEAFHGQESGVSDL